MRSRIEPCHAASQYLDAKRAVTQIDLVHIRDLELSSRRGTEVLRDLYYAIVIKVEAWNGEVGSRLCRLLFKPDHLAHSVEFHDAVPLGITNVVAEDRRACRGAHDLLKLLRESVTKEKI